MIPNLYGVVFAPGTYEYDGKQEVVTAEELEKITYRQPSTILTIGHPSTVFPKTTDIAGKAFLRWNKKHQRLVAKFLLDEDRLPDSIRSKLNSQSEEVKKIPVSPGFLIDQITEEGVQYGMMITHIALLDGENPQCPLSICGVNVRPNSNGLLLRYAKQSDISTEKPESESPSESQEKPVFTEAQEKRLEEFITKFVTVEPVIKEDTQHVESNDVVKPELGSGARAVDSSESPEPEIVPEVVFPAEATGAEIIQTDASGWVSYIPGEKSFNKKKE